MALTPHEVRYGQLAVAAGWVARERLVALSQESQQAGVDLRAHLLRGGVLSATQDQAIVARLSGGGPTPAPGLAPTPAAPGARPVGSAVYRAEQPTATGSNPGGPPAAIPLADTTTSGTRKLSLLGRELPSPGQRLGPYLIERELARGGLGAVFVACSPAGEQVALKVLLDQGQGNHLARFKREAEVGQRLDHPGICAILDHGEHGGVAFLTMPFLEGARPISEYADAEGLGPWERIDLMLQVLDALHAAHEAGVVHRDLKPANVLVTPAGQAKVVDFGLVKDLDRSQLTKTGHIMGTPHYMAPEQVMGEAARVDRRCDVFALGVILFELLSGRLPFDSDTSVGLMRAILEADMPDLGALPDGLGPAEDVLRAALAKDPDGRYPSAAAMAADLRAVQGGRAVSVLARAGREARRQRRLVGALAALAALVLIGLVGVAAWRSRNPHALPVAERTERTAELAREVDHRLRAGRSLVTHPPDLAVWEAELGRLLRAAPPDAPLPTELEDAAARVRFARGAAALCAGEVAVAEASAAALSDTGGAEAALLRAALIGALVGVGARPGEPAAAAEALTEALGHGLGLPELRGWRALAVARGGIDAAEAEAVQRDLRALGEARPLTAAERETLARACLELGEAPQAAEVLAGVADPARDLVEALALAQAKRHLGQHQPAEALRCLREQGAPIRGHLTARRDLRDAALERADGLIDRVAPGKPLSPENRAILLDLLRLARTALPEEPLPPSVRDPCLVAAENGISPDYELGIAIAELMPEDFKTQSRIARLLIRSGLTIEQRRRLCDVALRALDLDPQGEAPGWLREDIGVALLDGLLRSRDFQTLLDESQARMALYQSDLARKDMFALRAQAYLSLHRYRDGLAEVERAIDLGTGDKKLRYYRFCLLEGLGRHEDAFPDAHAFAISGIELGGPRHLTAVVFMWEWGRSRGHGEAVRAAVESFLRSGDPVPGWSTRAALLELEAGLPQQARANLERAARLLPAQEDTRLQAMAADARRAAAALPDRPDEALTIVARLVEALEAIRGPKAHVP